MGDIQATITAALGDLERASAAISRVNDRIDGAAPPDAVFGLSEASHAAHHALIALRQSLRAVEVVAV